MVESNQEQKGKEPPKPDISTREAALKVSADLLINSSKLVQGWITRFVVVNVALFSAVSVILSWEKGKLWMLMPICMIGFIASIPMLGVILRQNEWQRKIQKIVLDNQEALGVEVHPIPEEVKSGEPKETFGEYTETLVWVMGIAVVVAWLALAVILLYQGVEPPKLKGEGLELWQRRYTDDFGKRRCSANAGPISMKEV